MPMKKMVVRDSIVIAEAKSKMKERAQLKKMLDAANKMLDKDEERGWGMEEEAWAYAEKHGIEDEWGKLTGGAPVPGSENESLLSTVMESRASKMAERLVSLVGKSGGRIMFESLNETKKQATNRIVLSNPPAKLVTAIHDWNAGEDDGSAVDAVLAQMAKKNPELRKWLKKLDALGHQLDVVDMERGMVVLGMA